MAHRQDPMGEDRAQLIARVASNLEPDESEALVLELLRQHGVQLLERVDGLPHQDVKAPVLGLIQRSQTLSWTEVVGAHASAHDQKKFKPHPSWWGSRSFQPDLFGRPLASRYAIKNQRCQHQTLAHKLDL